MDTINRVNELFVRYTKSTNPKVRMQLEAQIKGIANENGYKPNTMTSLTKVKNELLRRLSAS